MDGGMLAITPNGEVITAWRRAGTVFTSLGSSDPEEMLGNGEQPWIASNTNGTYVAWITVTVHGLGVNFGAGFLARSACMASTKYSNPLRFCIRQV